MATTSIWRINGQIQDFKYDILKHPNLKFTTDGGADPYRHGQDLISFASFDINEKMLKEASETPVGKEEYTKIVLRTPEGNDREIVGRSMGLNQNQTNEIAKLPGGVAVVYQNNWVSPVLTLVDKAAVEEKKYVYKRPSSFEPKITVDGQEFTDLPDDLKKIYNDGDVSIFKKATTTIGEKFGVTHELSKKSGLVAAGITFSVSTVDNVSAFIDGEISAEEMVVDITKDTVSAGVLGYGTQFITTTVSQAMTHSSSTLIKTVGGSCLPAAAVSFAVDSYDSVTAFAKGEIDGAELAYDLGESAATVAGSFAGGAAMGAAVGTIAGPIGTVAGTVVGGVVGCVIASEVYASAVELGAELYGFRLGRTLCRYENWCAQINPCWL